jgi:hypothetical protein
MYRAGMVMRGQLVRGAYAQLVDALVGADEMKMDRLKEGMLQLTRGWDRHEVERTRRVAQEVAEMQGMDSAVPVAGPYDVIAIVEAASTDAPRQDGGLPVVRRISSTVASPLARSCATRIVVAPSRQAPERSPSRSLRWCR